MAKTVKKPLTKTQIIAQIAENTELSKKDVAAVIDTMCEMIRASIGPKGEGAFTLPGLLKVEKKHVKAQPAKKGVANPLRPGEVRDIPAKPAHERVKVRALKGLKEAVK